MNIILNQIASIIGKDNIIEDGEGLVPYSRGNISFVPERSPLFAVKPGTVEEVKALLRMASQNKMPVTPFSSSVNGHGGAIPTVPGMTIDMRRLNRIHLIDDVERNAIIEPGVTFAQLQKQAHEKGLRALVPVDLPADASVISSCLDMCPLYAWPKYDTETVLTLELLLPNGELVKTGAASLPIMNEKPYLPIMTPPVYMEKLWFGSQGTLAIATKAALKLKTVYDHNEVVFIPFNSFAEALPAIREVRRLDLGVEFFIANATYLGGLLAENDESFEALKASLPAVTAVLVFRGDRGRVDYQRADLEDLCQQLSLKPAETFSDEPEAGKKILDELEFPRGYQRFEQLKGAYHVIPFICMAMQVPMFNMVVSQITQAFGIDKKDLGEMLLPAEPSRFHFQYSFYSNPGDPQDTMKTMQLFKALSSTLIKMGGFFSRPYGEWAEQVYGKANAYKSLLKEFKEVIDPEHIMNPGKLDL